MKVPYSWRGFTLIEMLVVIAIIAILVGILFSVFGPVREQARQTQCISNLSQLGIALKAYRTDHGRYPFAPMYDNVTDPDHPKYVGGFSALYPTYVDDKSLFICPDDRNIDGKEKEARQRNYCSYNGQVTDIDTSDEDTWKFDEADYTHIETGATISDAPTRTYNYGGYENSGVDCYNSDPDDNGYYPYMTGDPPSWLTDEGLKRKHYPRLMNRQAPDTTIVTHCIHHRGQYNKDTEQMDLILRLSGSTDKVNRKAWQHYDSGEVSKFVKQRE